MPVRPPLLTLDAREASRRIALDLLSEAERALVRLDDPEDTEALHDFRVAIRKLRSTLRAYRGPLGSAASKKIRGRLRDLGRATNAGRDAEVQRSWVSTEREKLKRSRRAGIKRMLKTLDQEVEEGYAAARADVRGDFERTAATLRPRLEEPGHETAERFATVAGRNLSEQASELLRHLAGIRGADWKEEAHEARIQAKRLRYLLEPLVREIARARSLIARLRQLQDLLGDLRDAQVLEDRIAGEMSGKKSRGLMELEAMNRERRDHLFGELERRWLSEEGAGFVAQLAEAGRLLAAPQADLETERKYLLKKLPGAIREAQHLRIEQGWLPGKRLRERLRRVKSNGKEQYYRAVKLGTGITRIELEEPTTRDVFRSMWRLTAGCRVRKHRYRIADGPLVWEIDDFIDRKLLLAEVELPSPDTPVDLPDWLAPCVEREVTGDADYVNLNLAR